MAGFFWSFFLRVACGRTAPPVCSGTNRKTASLSAVRCAADLLRRKPESGVSLGDTLSRQFVSSGYKLGKPALHQRCASQFPRELSCQPVGMLKQQMSSIEHTEKGSTRQSHP
jgi:hypothetical protein